MKAEEEFDDIFRKRSEEARFEYRESDWEKVRRQIDEQRLAEYRSASGINYWIVSTIALLGSAILIYLSVPKTPASANPDEVVYEPEPLGKGALASLQSQNVSVFSRAEKGHQTRLKPQPIAGLEPKGNTEAQKQTPAGEPGNEPAAAGRNEPLVETSGSSSEHEAANTPQEESITRSGTDMQSLSPRSGRLEPNTEKDRELYSAALKFPAEPDYAEKPFRKRHSVNLELGLLYSGNWSEASFQSGRQFSAYGGVNYVRALSAGWSLSMGAQLYNLKGMDQVFYENSSNAFGFGSTTTQTVLTCHSMMFVSFPLRMMYQPTEDLGLSLGLHAGSLIMASNTEEINSYSDGQLAYQSSRKQNGIYENMSSANFMLSAGVLTALHERVMLQAELYFGISDLFAEQSGAVQHSNGFRVGLQYRFTGK